VIARAGFVVMTYHRRLSETASNYGLRYFPVASTCSLAARVVFEPNRSFIPVVAQTFAAFRNKISSNAAWLSRSRQLRLEHRHGLLRYWKYREHLFFEDDLCAMGLTIAFGMN
jgi:hypothetical protein